MPLARWKKSPHREAFAVMENGLPLLGGEGWREGEVFFQLNASGHGRLGEGQAAPAGIEP
jgi:hypothetical protein